MYFQMEATHAQNQMFSENKTVSDYRGETNCVETWGDSMCAMFMSRRFCQFSDSRPQRWLLYKKIKILIWNIQDPMMRSSQLPKWWGPCFPLTIIQEVVV